MNFLFTIKISLGYIYTSRRKALSGPTYKSQFKNFFNTQQFFSTPLSSLDILLHGSLDKIWKRVCVGVSVGAMKSF